MMKHTTTAIVASFSLAAGAAKVSEWPQLPDGTLPDTEVSTNIPLRVNAEQLDMFSLKLHVADTGASEVLVAVGHDADEDGDLSADEAAFVFGQDCGERYLVNHRTGRMFTGMGDTIVIGRRDFDPAWNLARIVKRGAGAIGETVTATVGNKHFTIVIR